jgi:predicted DNA-binding protein with PD1-like motif
MKWKLINDSDEKTFVLVFDTGDEVISDLTRFAKEHQLKAAQFAGIGACLRVTLGFFEIERKDYRKIEINEQVEVMSLLGNISVSENSEPKVHGHMVVGKLDGTAYGGHLLEAHVRPTLELFLVEHPGQLQRKMNEQFGLALIELTE